MILFSVIVPVYNVEQYLDECVKSLIQQTYRNMEIILVDDGSTDLSGMMCDEYAKMDNRIHITHKKNGGQSSARNEGLKQAKGDYILYVDSDDYISPDFLELMEQQLSIQPYDMIIAKIVNFTDGSNIKMKHIQKGNICLSPEQALENAYYQNLFDVSNGAKVIKSNIANECPFQEGMIYEDFKNMYKLISKCDSVLYMSEPRYFYRQRVNSTMNSSFDNRKWILIDIARENLDFVKENYPNIIEAAVRRYVYSNFHILGRVIRIDNLYEESEKLRDNILTYKRNILMNRRVCLKEKISVCILGFGLKPYRMFWNLYCRLKGKKV